jgi:hypothetical protein
VQIVATSSEHEPAPSSEDAIQAWREWLAATRDERVQQRGDPYAGRHRLPPDHPHGHSDPI